MEEKARAFFKSFDVSESVALGAHKSRAKIRGHGRIRAGLSAIFRARVTRCKAGATLLCMAMRVCARTDTC